MLLQIHQALLADDLARCRELIDNAEWADGRITAGSQSGLVKNNRQLPENAPAAQEARAIVLAALSKSPMFLTGALPKKIFPPLFNRYDGDANAFGNHIDNAIRHSPATGTWVRTDLSATLFLSNPEDYDGGELVIEDTYGTQSIKLPAGDLILYPSSSVHRVQAVTRGARLAAFFWIESMVRDDAQRSLLFNLDMSILSLRETYGEIEPAVRLTGSYHNLLRMWAET
ncbi:Fe2+-dependent dioxygenase [Paraherbaspirillum soli]|uniref:Fe2+-dependent dioxygenase n=1 Tax=Paraherbaspirillum soli TaxID=631222 RepID=A0ABW0MGN4_9BURK